MLKNSMIEPATLFNHISFKACKNRIDHDQDLNITHLHSYLDVLCKTFTTILLSIHRTFYWSSILNATELKHISYDSNKSNGKNNFINVLITLH